MSKLKKYFKLEYAFLALLHLFLASNVVVLVAFLFGFLALIVSEHFDPGLGRAGLFVIGFWAFIVLLALIPVKYMILPLAVKILKKYEQNEIFNTYLQGIRCVKNRKKILLLSLCLDIFFIFVIKNIAYANTSDILTPAILQVLTGGLSGSYLALFAWWAFLDWRKRKIVTE